MPSLAKIPIRLQLSAVSNPPSLPVDVNTGLPPQIWRSADVAFQIGIFDAAGVAVNLGNVDFLEVDIFPMSILNIKDPTNFNYNQWSVSPYPNLSPAPLLFSTVEKADITATVSKQVWQNGTGQQAIAAFTWNQTAQLELNGASFADFWLVVSGLIGTNKFPYGGTRLRVYESGSSGIYIPNAAAPLVVPEDTIFYIGPNTQIPFTLPITVDGTIVADGQLVQV